MKQIRIGGRCGALLCAQLDNLGCSERKNMGRGAFCLSWLRLNSQHLCKMRQVVPLELPGGIVFGHIPVAIPMDRETVFARSNCQSKMIGLRKGGDPNAVDPFSQLDRFNRANPHDSEDTKAFAGTPQCCDLSQSSTSLRTMSFAIPYRC
jgi:hypothetical protein